MKQSIKFRLNIRDFLDSLTMRLDFQLLVNSQNAQKYIFQKDQNIKHNFKKKLDNKVKDNDQYKITKKKNNKKFFALS